MLDPKLNPDVIHFSISSMPVLIITGSDDRIEPNVSAWRDFAALRTPNKVFVDVQGAGHLAPIEGHAEGPFLAFFSQAFALGNSSAADLIYGSSPGSLRQVLPITQTGGGNVGDGQVGYLGCRFGLPSVPPEFSVYCSPVSLHP